MPKSRAQSKDPHGLNARQRRFVEEYLVDLNATRAAKAAGYADKGAEVRGSELLRNRKVATAITAGQEKRSKRLELKADRVLQEVVRLAMSDLRRAAKWNEDGVTLTSSDDLDDDIAAAISEVGETFGSEGRKGVKIKLHDKGKALGELMDHLGLRGAKRLKFENADEAAEVLERLLGVDASKLKATK